MSQENIQRFQEIANRGLQDRLDPDKRARFDEAVRRGLITSPAQPESAPIDFGSTLSVRAQRELSPEQQQQLLAAREAQIRAAPPMVPPDQREAAIQERLETPSRPVESENIIEFFRSQAPKGTKLARDLPEIGSAPQLNEFSLGALQRSAAANLITNEAELGAMLQQDIPGSKLMQDPEGRAIIEMPDGGQFAVNKPGLSTQDVMQTVSRVLAFVPAGRAQGLGRTVGAAAGTETGLQGVETALGGEFTPGDIGAEAVFSGAGGIVAGKLEKFFRNRSQQKQKIIDLVKENADEKQLAAFTRDIPRAQRLLAEAAEKQGVDKGTADLILSSTPRDKALMRRALKILRGGKLDKRFAISNRPGDVAGDALKTRYDAVARINRQAGAQVSKAAKGLKGKSVDLSSAYGDFINELQDLGVSITRDKNGKLKGIYNNSEFARSKGTQKALNDFLARSETTSMDGLAAHRLKKIIDGSVEFGKKSTKDPILSRGESLLKGLRSSVNETLQDLSPAYRAANLKFADTRSAMDAFEKAVGPSFNPASENAGKQLVNAARSLMSNNQKRIPAMDSINALQQAAKKYGVSFKDDILTQAAFMDELETLFGSAAPTSFGGQIEKTGAQILTGDTSGLLAEGVKEGIKRARGINEEGLFKALEELLQ